MRDKTIITVALLGALFAVAPEASAQSPAELVWGGCWQLQNARTDETVDDVGDRAICIEPAANELTIVTYVDGEEVRRDAIGLDGTPRLVEDGGCSGEETAGVSGDGHRLYTRADLVCEGGRRRQATGISALLSPDAWIDIQVIRVGDEREMMVRRFRYDGERSQQLWQRLGRDDLSLAARTARTEAAELLDVDDVIEASRAVDTAAVEALLIESDAMFDLDGQALLTLADADVPAPVIDLMVALSFPDYFVVNEPEEPAVGYGYPVNFYGYWSPAFSPFFGWNYYYPWYPVGRPPIGPRPPVGRYGGKVVNGHGYARVAANPQAPDGGGLGGFLRNFGSGGGGGSSVGSGGSAGGKATPQGARSGGSGSTRKAKRRGESGESGESGSR